LWGNLPGTAAKKGVGGSTPKGRLLMGLKGTEELPARVEVRRTTPADSKEKTKGG